MLFLVHHKYRESCVASLRRPVQGFQAHIGWCLIKESFGMAASPYRMCRLWRIQYRTIISQIAVPCFSVWNWFCNRESRIANVKNAAHDQIQTERREMTQNVRPRSDVQHQCFQTSFSDHGITLACLKYPKYFQFNDSPRGTYWMTCLMVFSCR